MIDRIEKMTIDSIETAFTLTTTQISRLISNLEIIGRQ